MGRLVASYPFPVSSVAIEDVIYVDCHQRTTDVYRRMWDRSQGDDARRARLQYLTIEEELERAYRYVTPCAKNAGTFSFKFAELILAAANAYEVRSKALYASFYNDQDEINIFNYLALDRLLDTAGLRVSHFLAEDSFRSLPEIRQPFGNLATWSKASPVLPAHVPGWWGAYNAVKHETAGLDSAATLANATSAVAALFLHIEAVYGFGVLSGGTYLSPSMTNMPLLWRESPRCSRLFTHDGGAFRNQSQSVTFP